MGREVRRVPANWQHPVDDRGSKVPLHDGYNKRIAAWDEENAKWQEGMRSDWKGGWQPLSEDEKAMSFSDWDGERPKQEDYMPDWPTEERTHYQMYEDTTEGTPISPVMDSPENLARWLADNDASAFASMTATYEQWLGMIDEGSTTSMAFIDGVVQSGVALVGDQSFSRNRDWPDVINED